MPLPQWVPETDFKEGHEAEKLDGKLAIKDLPRVFCAEDVGFGTDSTLESVARLFNKGKVVDGKFDYEGCTLCHLGMIVSSQVTDEREGHRSAFFDVGCSTRSFPVSRALTLI